ncbi:MAG: ATP-dependent helicase RecG, ATP-dependent helicase RecG [Candidatus Parcubacteria bacterium]|jgi:ATP-dependent DNA helicase RecG
MLVGTHALIQKSVQFQHLAYAIVDEQHRFGTRQRRELAHKGDAAPHFLSMTATPIPRTLALTIYGDLDLSVLDELPPGRAKVTTRLIRPEQRNIAYDKVREELAKGRQAYIICPRIEEPDPEKLNALQAKSAKAEATRLQKEVFTEYTVGLLHGAMRPEEKDSVMKDFSQNHIQILVATSVVEVGVNVPNATVILIEGAERFGLAQLHQLRGRVMRSSHPPFCFLLPESKGQVAIKRLRTLEKSDDGFKLAEADLETRGAGDLYGRRQWGVSDLGMEALKNPKLIEAARAEAQGIVRIDPTLSNHPVLRTRVQATLRGIHTE